MSEIPSNLHESGPSDVVVRDLGMQPIADLMIQLNLKPHDLVTASSSQITHKLITRAMKGRRLTPHSKRLVQHAISAATGRNWSLSDLFSY
ncbi:MAG: hypothetical protein ACK58L_12930 [Planctomycetota bacterium]